MARHASEATAAEAPTGAPEAEPANEPATDGSAALTAPEGGTGVASETQPEARLSVKEQLLAACEAADYWLRAELQRPGETRPDNILRTLRAAIDRARQQPRRAATRKQPGQPRADTKQARLIAMLQQGATISEMVSELGWLRHTCHGALAGLKKKRGLRITSDKHAGGERVYHIVSA